jgi:hypothetical protein
MGAVTGKLLLDNDLVRVAEFMEIEADRLSFVADRLPALARLIWSEQRCASLERPFTSVMPSSASESGLVAPCAGDDSVVVVGECKLK